jgi:hypothetical protein
MTMKKSNITFQDFLEILGYKPHSYSNAFTQGHPCLAITVENPLVANTEIAFEAGLRAGEMDDERERRGWFIFCLQSRYEPNADLDYVIYWPGWDFKEDDMS